jgi:hypothetical protein
MNRYDNNIRCANVYSSNITGVSILVHNECFSKRGSMQILTHTRLVIDTPTVFPVRFCFDRTVL